MSAYEDFERDHQVKSPSGQSFGLVFVLVFMLIGLWPLVQSGLDKGSSIRRSLVKDKVVLNNEGLWTFKKQ